MFGELYSFSKNNNYANIWEEKESEKEGNDYNSFGTLMPERYIEIYSHQMEMEQC